MYFKYPQCKECQNFYVFLLKSKKIVLYCDNCTSSIQYKVNDKLLDLIFSNEIEKIKREKISDFECEKCKNKFCQKCYINHKDFVNSCHLTHYMRRNENNVLQKMFIKEEKYSYYNMVCDKCKKSFLNGIINTKIPKLPNLQEMEKNLKKAEKYLDYYYLYQKNQIISELQEKIKLIENTFNENNNYHRNIFDLIKTLLSISKQIHSTTVMKSLINLTHFNFPKIELNDINNLNDKVVAICTFYQNNFLVSEQEEKEPIQLFNNYREVQFNLPQKLIQLNDKRFLYLNRNMITIFDSYNFNIELTITIPFLYISCVNQLAKNKLLIGSKIPYICYFDKKGYSLHKYPVFHNGQINHILILKNKDILTSSLYKIIITNGKFPYEIKTIIKENNFIYEVLELSNERILYELSSKTVLLQFYNINTKKKRLLEIKFHQKYNMRMTEINNKTIAVSCDQYLFFFNSHIYQIESEVLFKEMIQEIKVKEENKNYLFIILQKSFKIINLESFQIIFNFESTMESLSNIFFLGNGTLMAVYPFIRKSPVQSPIQKESDKSPVYLENDELPEEIESYELPEEIESN